MNSTQMHQYSQRDSQQHLMTNWMTNNTLFQNINGRTNHSYDNYF